MAQPILGIAPGTRPREAAKQQIVLEMLDFLPSRPCLVKKMVSDIADMLAKVYLDKELCGFFQTLTARMFPFPVVFSARKT